MEDPLSWLNIGSYLGALHAAVFACNGGANTFFRVRVLVLISRLAIVVLHTRHCGWGRFD